MKKMILVLVVALSFVAGNAFATEYLLIEDNWIDWPGYNSGVSADELGTPNIQRMVVGINNSIGDSLYGILETVTIELKTPTRRLYDSLFINGFSLLNPHEPWDSWDSLIKNTSTGATAYNVTSGWSYTTAASTSGSNVRVGNPNGIEGLARMASQDFSVSNVVTVDTTTDWYDPTVGVTHSFTYNLSSLMIDFSKGFAVAYSPWCANDVIGGGYVYGDPIDTPVPEPATMLLLGSGLIGLAFYRRKMKK